MAGAVVAAVLDASQQAAECAAVAELAAAEAPVSVALLEGDSARDDCSVEPQADDSARAGSAVLPAGGSVRGGCWAVLPADDSVRAGSVDSVVLPVDGSPQVCSAGLAQAGSVARLADDSLPVDSVDSAPVDC